MSLLADRYRLGTALGRCADAEVREATDRRLQRRVAVTLVRGGAATSHRTVQRAHAAATISHPNLLTVLDAGEDGHDAFVVTDHVDGDTLGDRLVHGPLEPREAVAILDGILAGLQALHARGRVVGGLSPWEVRLGHHGLSALAVLPAADGDAAPLPLGGALPSGTIVPARPAHPASHIDCAAVGVLAVAACTGAHDLGDVDDARALLPQVHDEVLAALAAAALDAEASAGERTARSLRRQLPGGAPDDLPATVALPVPGPPASSPPPAVPRGRLRRLVSALSAVSGR